MSPTRGRFVSHVLVMLCLATLPSLAQSPPTKPTLYLDGCAYYKPWLEQDVRWIITDEERAAFKMLRNDLERDDFSEAFWQRRNPRPDEFNNSYKVEHYQRIAYANEQFGALGKSGWSTDRGRIYILYGQPDEIQSYPNGRFKGQVADDKNTSVKDSFPPVEDHSVPPGEDVSHLPLEIWRYRYLEGIGQDVELAFVDVCRCGDYRMRIEPSLRDALLMPRGLLGMSNARQEPGNYRSYVESLQNPSIKFPDLHTSLSKVILNPLPFEVRTDFVKATDLTSIVFLTIAIPRSGVKFIEEKNSRHAQLNIFARLSTLMGRVTDEFEDTIEIDETPDSAPEQKSLHVVALPLRAGRYRLDIAIKDVTADRKGIWARSLLVPQYCDAILSTSSLALAEKVDTVTRGVDKDGFFRAGTRYVRPYTGNIPGELHILHGRPATAWMQVYGLASESHTHLPSVTIDYDIVNRATGGLVFHDHSPTSSNEISSDVMTVKKSLPTTDLHVGTYRFDILVKDEVSRATVKQSVEFVIE